MKVDKIKKLKQEKDIIERKRLDLMEQLQTISK